MPFAANALRLLALVGAATAAAAKGNVFAPAEPAETAAFTTLLVQFREDPAAGPSALSATAQGAATTVHGKVTHTYRRVLQGSAIRVPAATAAASMRTLSADPTVTRVEEDKKTRVAYSWGLDRVDQCALPLDGPGSPLTKVDATGVRVYILDTGIYKDHDEFVGMIDRDSDCHEDFSNDGGPFADEDGHGTHVAGTACGLNYGVATCDTVCALKVFDNEGDGLSSWFLAALDKAVEDCVASFPARADRKCVANFSGGGEYSPTENEAVANAVDEGLWVVVAAMNDGTNAAAESPASEPRAITVASTKVDDDFSSWSNYGDSVDVYAPGSDIVSAGIGGADRVATMSGTSMASPHVAGIAAGILREDPSADVEAVLKANAQMIGTHEGFPMLLATTVAGGCGGIPPTLSPAPTLAPTVCGLTTIKVVITTDNFPDETSYEIKDQDGDVVAEGGPYTDGDTEYSSVHCLPLAVYTFILEDSYGDGFDNGSYQVFMDGIVEASGPRASFDFQELTTIPGTPSPTDAPTTTCDGTTIRVDITTDGFPEETSYKIEDQDRHFVVGGGNYTGQYTEYSSVHCLPLAVYTFILEDSYGDGFFGSYQVFMDGIEEASGPRTWEYDVDDWYGESTTIPSTPSPTDAPTTPSPTSAPTACDQTTIIVAITTDGWPTETSYEIKDQEGEVVASFDDYTLEDTLLERVHCLPMAVYDFIIYDEHGDGLNGDSGFGTYQVFVDGIVEASGPRDEEGFFSEELTKIGRDGAAYHTLGSGACAAPVLKREQCKEAGSRMAMDWKGAISNPKKPGGCVVMNDDEVAFNTVGEKGTGCKPGAQCVCTTPYALEAGRCAKPLTKPLTKLACEEAATVWGDAFAWKGLMLKAERPRGCFVNVRRNGNGRIVGGEVFFNKKGKKGTKCTWDMPCMCSV